MERANGREPGRFIRFRNLQQPVCTSGAARRLTAGLLRIPRP